MFRAQDQVEMGLLDLSSHSHLYIFNLGLGQQQLLVIVSLSLLSLCLQLQHGFLGLSQSLSEICNLTDNDNLTCLPACKEGSQSQTTKILTMQSADESSLVKMMEMKQIKTWQNKNQTTDNISKRVLLLNMKNPCDANGYIYGCVV